jgi:hypothetical protein
VYKGTRTDSFPALSSDVYLSQVDLYKGGKQLDIYRDHESERAHFRAQSTSYLFCPQVGGRHGH